MDISRMLTISTAHITKETADKLEYDCKAYTQDDYFANSICFNAGIAIYPMDDHGWLLWIPASVPKKIPSDLQACIELAIDHRCDWLCLDADGLIEDSLQIYEWED